MDLRPPVSQRVNNLRFGAGDFLDGSGVILARGLTVFNSGHDNLNGGSGQNLNFAATANNKNQKHGARGQPPVGSLVDRPRPQPGNKQTLLPAFLA